MEAGLRGLRSCAISIYSHFITAIVIAVVAIYVVCCMLHVVVVLIIVHFCSLALTFVALNALLTYIHT